MAEKKTTKPKITDKYKVKVFNNTGGKVGFQDIHGNWRVIQTGAYEMVNFEDLDNLNHGHRSFLEGGYVYVGDKYAREKLNLDYENVIQYRNIKDIILNQSVSNLKELLKNAEDWVKREFGRIAHEIKMDLPLSKIKYLSEISKIDLTDIEE